MLEVGDDVVAVAESHPVDLPDVVILELARKQGRIIVTFDRDFGRLLARDGASEPSVLLLRLSDQTPPFVIPRLVAALDRHADDLRAGAIVTVDDSQTRVRRLPIAR